MTPWQTVTYLTMIILNSQQLANKVDFDFRESTFLMFSLNLYFLTNLGLSGAWLHHFRFTNRHFSCYKPDWCSNDVQNFCLYSSWDALKKFITWFEKLIINHFEPTHLRSRQTRQLENIDKRMTFLILKWKFWKATRFAKAWCVFVINDVPFHFSCLLLILSRKHSTDKLKL